MRINFIWHLIIVSLFSFADKACSRSVIVPEEGQSPYCSFCACPIYDQQDLVRIFAGELDEEGAVLYWSLDDGTEEVTLAEAGQEVTAVSQLQTHTALLGTSALNEYEAGT